MLLYFWLKWRDSIYVILATSAKKLWAFISPFNSGIFSIWKQNEAQWTEEPPQHLSVWWNCYWFMTNARAGRQGLGCCCQRRTESRQVLLSITGCLCKTAAPIIMDLMAPNYLSSRGQSGLWLLSHAWHWHKKEVTWLLRGKGGDLKGCNLLTNSVIHKLSLWIWDMLMQRKKKFGFIVCFWGGFFF